MDPENKALFRAEMLKAIDQLLYCATVDTHAFNENEKQRAEMNVILSYGFILGLIQANNHFEGLQEEELQEATAGLSAAVAQVKKLWSSIPLPML